MDCDKLIDELMSVADPQGAGLDEMAPPAAATVATPDAPQDEERVQKRRERPAAIAAGGQARQYGLVVRGKTFTADQIDALDNTEIEKLYARYEARLGAAMTKTLGSAVLQLYAGMAAMFLPIENQPGLIADLESDPFVGHALSSATCELYHRPLRHVPCTAYRCADHLEALPIWTLLPCWSIRWRRRSRRIKRRRRS